MSIKSRRRPNGSTSIPVHSFRCEDHVWDSARARAEGEGVTMSNVIHTIIEGYGQHQFDLPEITLKFKKAS